MNQLLGGRNHPDGGDWKEWKEWVWKSHPSAGNPFFLLPVYYEAITLLHTSTVITRNQVCGSQWLWNGPSETMNWKTSLLPQRCCCRVLVTVNTVSETLSKCSNLEHWNLSCSEKEHMQLISNELWKVLQTDKTYNIERHNFLLIP